MKDRLVEQLRSFSRGVAQSFGVMHDDYLGLNRPLAEARLLFEIGEDGAGIASVRAKLDWDSAYLSRMLRSLERQGLVTVRPDPADGRLRFAGLTGAGSAELRELDCRSNEVGERILRPLSERQRVALAQAMGTVERLLEASAARIEEVRPTSRAARECLELYYAELQEHFEAGFSPDYSGAPSLEEFAPPSGAFLLVRLHSRPIGCGAFKKLSDERAYLKRMWISPSARGLGLGRRLLGALEEKAFEKGYRIACLETHESLEEAQSLYRSTGYAEVRPFNDEPYAHLWFEKALAP